MKIQLLLFSLISFTIPLISMEAPPQALQQKIAAAQLHNRILCPLARLPRDVQDMIAEYLEFNDRESDEEFVRNSQKIITIAQDYRLGNIREADKLLLDTLKPFETRGQLFPEVKIIRSRDKSKLLMLKNYTLSPTEKGCYYFVYDFHTNQTLFSKFILDTSVAVLNIPLALSNDGKFILQKHQPATGYHYELFSTEAARTITYTYNVPENFNKQSTKYISHSPKYINIESSEDSQRSANQKRYINLFDSEQEHQKRSKKTLALYLHQKGICKPFNYTSIQ